MLRRINDTAGGPNRAGLACQEGPMMELAAVVLFSSMALWFIEEVRGALDS
jgi:hypothetical protein